MKKNIKKILSFALMLSLLVGMMAGFSVFAAEEETPAVEIVSKNVYYADTLKLMYAVRTDDADVVLNIYDENNNLLETITKHESQAVNGMDVEVFISSFGVPAQDIDTVFYAEAVLSDGTKSAKVRYSVLEYLYERLTVSANVSAEQKLMYNNLLAFADSADIVVNKTAADKSIANYAYVRVNNGTVDGAYSAAMLMAGTKLDKLATDYVVESGKVLVWEVNAYEIGKTPAETVLSEADVVEFAVEAGKVYELTPNSVESGEPIITTVSTTVADYATANGWNDSTKYTTITLDNNVTITATGSSNTGKYYNSGKDWRIYQTESPTVKISVPADKKIVTVNITYNYSNSGVLTLNGSNIKSNTVLDVNASSIVFGVGNTGTATNGQVRITAIEVVYTDVPAHDCVYSDATCTTPKICTVCGATDGEALGHSYDDGVETTPATCTDTGVKTFTCHCGDTKTEDIEALGHTTDNGTCTRCDKTIGGSNTPVEDTVVSLNIFANKGVKVDKVINWTSGDVTVSNAQASSSTAIRTSDSDHYRVYKNSELTISANGGTIKKIVITCAGGDYATALKNSLNTTGVTATVSGSVVTIAVTDANVDSIFFVATEQIRINKVEVTYTK